MPDSLNSIFNAVIFKTLAQVDLPERGSNQHEINGVAALKDFFEKEQQVSGTISWHYFTDDSDPLQSSGNFTFYDARAKSASRTGRTEWRMYYSGDFLSCANPGDVLILARTLSGTIFGLIFQNGSGWLRIAQVLFQFEGATPRLQLITSDDLQGQKLEFAKRQILEELGLEVSIPLSIDDNEIAVRELALANKEGKSFPSTKRMAELAHTLVDVDITNNDSTLIAYIDREERIFRAIEKILVDKKLKQGFSSVDDFIEYSLSVQNRRKSRMGYALQNHLAKLFTENKLIFEAQALTEGKSKPDFIFPGEKQYHDKKYKTDLLVMLAAKSSCKERWRQILDEAERITNKHLCTLEQAISVDQTSVMFDRKVTLVIPSTLHSTYTTAQRKNLWTVNQFIDFVKFKQTRN
jgi:hypothetical protein